MTLFRLFLVLMTSLLVSLPSALAAAEETMLRHVEERNNHPNTPPDATSKALEKARDHLLDAMDALGEAGILTYDKHMPDLRDKTGKALEEAQSLLKSWEELTRKELQALQKKQQQERQKRKRQKRAPGQPNQANEEEMPSI